jgi:Fe-S-cluster-containing hydrogenase component 2
MAAAVESERLEMTDTALAALDLLCPRGHLAATLIKQSADQQTEISRPDAAPERWPRARDDDYTRLHCQQCNPPEPLAGPTGAIRAKVSDLVSDESECTGSYTLSFS